MLLIRGKDIHWGTMNFVELPVFLKRRVDLPLSGMYRLVQRHRVPSCWKDSGPEFKGGGEDTQRQVALSKKIINPNFQKLF